MPNSREWAILILLGVFAAIVMSRKGGRSAVTSVLRAGAHIEIVLPLAGIVIYTGLACWLGSAVWLWNTSLIKDTTVWFFTSALVLFWNFDKASKEPRFFRRRIKAVIGISVFIEFLSNLFTLHVVAELFVVTGIVFLSMLSAVAAMKSEHRVVKRMADGVLSVIVLGLLGYAVYRVATEWHTVFTLDKLREFVLPMWLSIGLLPYVYCVTLYSNFEMAFKRVDWMARNKQLSTWRAKIALLTTLHLRARDSGAFGGPWIRQLVEASTLKSARQTLKDFRQSRRDDVREKAEAEARLIRYAGCDGVDEEGRRLDRREFKETMSALRWVSTCQVGWHNREGRYRADLMTIMTGSFSMQGLPEPSGIELQVSSDGQRWYAWRRTVSGWCFAIGSAAAPPDEWRYDGAEPPNGFPGQDQIWGSRPFFDDVAQNWQEAA